MIYNKLGIYIVSFSSIIVRSIGIAGASFSLVLPLTQGIIKRLLKATRNKKRHDMISMLAISKLNSIETPISQALIDSEISHEVH